MINRKLVKVDQDLYSLFIDGKDVYSETEQGIKVVASSFGFFDVDLAFKVMNSNNHEVADFGLRGNFILSQKFEESDLGGSTYDS